MNIRIENNSRSTPDIWIKCLLFRRYLSILVSLLVMLFIWGCGKKINSQDNKSQFLQNVNFYVTDRADCAGNQVNPSRVSIEIKKLYEESFSKNRDIFFMIPQKYYTYNKPLILSSKLLETRYLELLSMNRDHLFYSELYFLYVESQRFEGQKCNVTSINESKKYDFRAYLGLTEYCEKKYFSQYCDDSEYSDANIQKNEWKNNAINLCKSFNSTTECEAEVLISSKNNLIGKLIKKYQTRFSEERFNYLFKLKEGSEVFSCKKSTDSNKTTMAIKVFDQGFNHDLLADLLIYVGEVWSSERLEIKFEIVSEYSKGVVSIMPTDKNISFVPKNNNRLIYLSKNLNLNEMKRILAHEFGHVLGFPDCYVEFFDDKNKEFVYFEMPQNKANIMCSLSNNFLVPEDYKIQIQQKSCNFN